MNRVGCLRRLSVSLQNSSKYRWGPNDITPPHIPNVDRRDESSNVPGIVANHRMRHGPVSRRRYLERGAATDYGATMTAEYGVIATRGMRLTFAQMNQIGLVLNRELNKPENKLRMMGAKAYFRIPDPWVAVTKKPVNTTRGGGVGRIVSWVSPVRARQIVLEIDCDCSYEHIYPVLKAACTGIEGKKMDHYQNFGFGKLMPMSRTYLEKMYEEERKIDMANENFFTHRELYAKNMAGIRNNPDRWRLMGGSTPEIAFHAEDGVGTKIHRTYKGLYR